MQSIIFDYSYLISDLCVFKHRFLLCNNFKFSYSNIAETIGIEGYGELGHVPYPSTLSNLISSVHSTAQNSNKRV